MSYNQLVDNCFFYPRHVGLLDNNHSCFNACSAINDKSGKGDIYLAMSMDSTGMIVKTCFKARGNPYLIAGLEWLCRQLQGSNAIECEKPDYQLLVKKLDIPIKYYSQALLIEKAWSDVMLALKAQYEEKKDE